MPFLEECTTHRSEALRVARPEAVGLAYTELRCLKKKAIDDDVDFALIFQDEMEIHRHSVLTRMWAPVG